MIGERFYEMNFAAVLSRYPGDEAFAAVPDFNKYRCTTSTVVQNEEIAAFTVDIRRCRAAPR